ncbi:MAG TPA: hypothetical protein VNT79_15465, partial [Phycisphaerae bacterium]|nr:hypothetical protein [Phycisphaerae bacterium]
MSQRFSFTTICMVMLATVPFVHAQSPPPPPTLVSPESGSSLVQPITVQWNAVVDPDGPIGSYIWQVGISSAFSTVILEGATNLSMPDMPMPTHDVVSGLPNGTYYWRVKATQMVDGPVGSLESPWSAVRTVTVTGLGPAPGTPSFTAPATGSQFHALEFFQIHWTTAPDAHHYLLEVDDEPAFSYPLTLTTDLLQFGTTFQAGWGNEIPNIYYRVRAVSAGNVRGLPSSTLNVKITNTAPVPSAPAPLAPSGGATVSVPFTFDWTDTPNPQIAGYDLDVDDEPNFQGPFGVLFVQNISRSDYMLAESLAPGTYYWRVRAIHGAVYGPWSAGASFTVVAPPPTPPGLRLFWIITEPGSVYGGNQTQACVTLNMPAPPGGAMVSIASDLPHA